MTTKGFVRMKVVCVCVLVGGVLSVCVRVVVFVRVCVKEQVDQTNK